MELGGAAHGPLISTGSARAESPRSELMYGGGAMLCRVLLYLIIDLMKHDLSW